MTRTVSSGATPAMLKWARERAGLSIELAAKKLKLAPPVLQDWENSNGSPSAAQLRKLGRLYKRPTMVFYLPEPPQDFTVVEDYRRLPHPLRTMSRELLHAIRIAQERQAWASDYLADTGAEESRIVKTAKLSEGPKVVGERLRHLLEVPIPTQLNWRRDSEAFSVWKAAVEAAGVYVFQTERLSIEEMRGCALSDKYCPVVLVNGQDGFRARAFTLMHELAHIFLGLSGISGGSQLDAYTNPSARIEQFCNNVAAECLVPLSDFVSRLPHNWKQTDDATISNMASMYRVSRLVILLRLVEAGAATEAYVAGKWAMYQRKPRKRTQDKMAVPPYRRALSRNGESFVRLAMAAYQEGEIHGGQLYDLLKIRMQYLPSLEKKIYSSRALPDLQ